MLQKELYKINILIIKYIPLLLALADLIHSIMSYYDYYTGVETINFFAGISVLPLLYLYVSSYSFKFCWKHRLPLHYVTISNLIALYDTHIHIPISDKQLLCMYFILTGIFIFIYLIYNQFYKHD